MDKKYIILEDYEVKHSTHSPTFETEQEAIDKATENLEENPRSPQYVTLVLKKVAAVLEPLDIKVEDV